MIWAALPVALDPVEAQVAAREVPALVEAMVEAVTAIPALPAAPEEGAVQDRDPEAAWGTTWAAAPVLAAPAVE